MLAVGSWIPALSIALVALVDQSELLSAAYKDKIYNMVSGSDPFSSSFPVTYSAEFKTLMKQEESSDIGRYILR